MTTFTRPGSIAASIALMILSTALFAVAAPVVPSDSQNGTTKSIAIVSPSGGQVVTSQHPSTIRWCARGVDTVRIEYSLDGGRSWILIAATAPAISQHNYHCPEGTLKHFLPAEVTRSMGSYPWSIPEGTTGEAILRVSDKIEASIAGVSDKPVTIAQHPATGWEIQSTGTSDGLVAVSIVDDKVAWTSGWGGVVFHTTNGGSSWIQGASVPGDATGICGLNADTAFVCSSLTDDGRVYRTTDGGVSWVLSFQYTGPSAAIENVEMFNEYKGVAVGNQMGGSSKTFKTTNAGASWDSLAPISQFGSGARDAVDWVGEQQGWFGTDASYVYHTTDGGVSWSPYDVGSLDILSLVFPDQNLGMLSTIFRYCYKSTDGGSSWTFVGTIPAPHPQTPVSFLAGTTVPTPRWWATGLDEIYRSTNFGGTWTYETVADGYPFNDISMKYIEGKHLLVGYAVAAADGVIMKYTEPVTSVPEDAANALPSRVQLFQNYPNPFNPSTTLTFTLPHSSTVTLSVFNILGQEVRKIVNEKMEAGTHHVQFDAGGLPSGVYLYRIESDGCTVSRKMVILK